MSEHTALQTAILDALSNGEQRVLDTIALVCGADYMGTAQAIGELLNAGEVAAYHHRYGPFYYRPGRWTPPEATS